MTVSSRRNKKVQREIAAVAAAQAAAVKRRKRTLLTIVAGVAIVIVVAGAIALPSSDKKSAPTATTTTYPFDSTVPSTAAPLTSAKGKPCVAVQGTLPKGAPAVPVVLGTAPSKLLIKDLKVGTGAVVTASQSVTVNYIGVACSTGKIFDSSWSGGTPASFALTGVIKGWTDGIPGMRIGGRRLLGIPSDLAYGPSGNSGIAPDEPLWFVVDMVSAK